MKIKTYQQVIKLLNYLREEAVPGREIPYGAALVLLELAMDDGLSMTDIMKRTGQSQSSASRNSRLLSRLMSPTREGFDLAEWVYDPTDFRSKKLVLNKNGKQVLAKITKLMEG